jgi:hypothetical protein
VDDHVERSLLPLQRCDLRPQFLDIGADLGPAFASTHPQQEPFAITP